jgi:hypothetical protein
MSDAGDPVGAETGGRPTTWKKLPDPGLADRVALVNS